MPSGAPSTVPDQIDRYQVLLPLASGGMATVYLARAMGLGGFEREVALKLMHAHLRDDPDFVASLVDEARLAGRIRHPNVVSVLDVGESSSGVFVVLDYVEGDSLSSLLRALRKQEQRLPLGVALRILDDVLSGLHAAHELTDADGAPMNLVHRDVTPHNVLVGTDGVSRLTDFGIAKAASRLVQTGSGIVKGKIAYMSPEQAQGLEIDRRTDVWAAGVVAWEMLTGMRLYEGPNDAAVLFKIVRDPPLRARTVVSEVPEAIDAVVARALERDPQARLATAEQFLEELVTAARAADCPIADRREVAKYLKPLVGAKLDERRTRMRRVQADRRVSDGAPQPDDEISGVAASSPRAAEPNEAPTVLESDKTPPPPTESATPKFVSQTATEAEPGLSEPVTVSATLEPTAEETVQTGTEAVATMAATATQPRKSLSLLALGAGLVGIAAVGLVVVVGGVRGSSEPTPTPSIAPDLSLSGAAHILSAGIDPGRLEPAIPVVDVERVPVEPQAEDAGAEAEDSEENPPPVRPTRPVVPKKPKPLGNPYNQ